MVVLRSPIHANEPSEYNGMLYRTSNRVLNNGIKVIILICMDGTSQYHHHRVLSLISGVKIICIFHAWRIMAGLVSLLRIMLTKFKGYFHFLAGITVINLRMSFF